jgi:hypothetical protein
VDYYGIEGIKLVLTLDGRVLLRSRLWPNTHQASPAVQATTVASTTEAPGSSTLT